MKHSNESDGVTGTLDSASLTPNVILALIVAQCLYGCGSVVQRACISEDQGVGYAVFLTYRYALVALLLVAAARLLEGAQVAVPKYVSRVEALSLAAFLIVSSYTFLVAIGKIGPFIPSIGETLIPVYVCAVCVVCRLEPVRRTKGAGVLCAVAGAALVVVHEEARRAFQSSLLEMPARPHLGMFVLRHVSELWLRRPSALSLGLAMCAVHIVAVGNYWMLKKHLLYRSTPLHLTAYVYMIGTMFALIVAIVSEDPFTYSTWTLTMKNVCALAYCVFESVLATGLLAWATKRTKATLISASMTLQPIFSAFLSWILFQTTLHADHLMGMLLTSCGLLLVVWSQSKEEDDGYTKEMAMASEKLTP